MFTAPQARNAIAQGNALDEQAYDSPSAESAKWRLRNETVRIKMPSRSLRAFNTRELDWRVPGPMAQAITFRAFGAAKPLGYFQSFANADSEDATFCCKADLYITLPGSARQRRFYFSKAMLSTTTVPFSMMHLSQCTPTVTDVNFLRTSRLRSS